MTENIVFNLPFTQKQVFLVYEDLLYRIDAPIVFLGRHPTNNFILNVPTISRFHARIKYENGWFSLYDFGSKYGTFVNGIKVKMQRLKSGDTIGLAEEELEFFEGSEQIGLLSRKITRPLNLVQVDPAQLSHVKIQP